jgi:hypothetical protein
LVAYLLSTLKAGENLKQKLLAVFIVIMSTFSLNCHASIINILRMIENYSSASLGVQRDILGGQNAIVDMQRDLLKSQREVEGIMRQMNTYLTGHSGWGTYQFHDYQTYGESAHDWVSVLRMAEQGQGSGALGQVIGGIGNQFPANQNTFNSGIAEPQAQKYYALKSQTVLATRAASVLDYNKIQDQITYQQMLQQQVENTKDLKAAIDLLNRIQVEGNLINLEILRQVALTNQQQSITEQATVNSALFNARFLTKK